MTQSTMNNGTQRKSLANQIDRLDTILDGLADALNESVAEAVKSVVGQVVREAVEAAIKEVLASPELLRAALDKHFPTPQTQPPPASLPKRKSLKELLHSARSGLVEKAKQTASQVTTKLGQACTWGLVKLRQGLGLACSGSKKVANRCVSLCGTLGAVARQLWRFRTPGVLALTVGVACGIGSYFAGPVIAGVASGISGAALTLAGMVLLPLLRMILGNNTNA